MPVNRFLLRRTLRTRLMFLASLSTLPAFLFVIYIAANERTNALRRAETEARYVAGLASREHAHQVEGARRLLERLASSDVNLPALLPPVLSGFPQVANLWMVTASGELAYSVVPPPRQISIADDPVFRAARTSGEVSVGRYQLGPIVGRPVLLMAVALRSGHVLIAALELSWLDQLARQARLPSESALVIADRNGTALAGASGVVERFRDLVAQPGHMKEVTIGNVERLAVAVPLEGSRDLWVVAGPPAKRVYAEANRVFVRDLAVLALFAIFAITTSLVTTDVSVLRDVRQLAGATRRFGEGELAVRAPLPRTPGEIRDLTVAFNSMADALEQRQERLRALSERLSAAREDEAARIAQELHDQLGQDLTVLKLGVENLRRKIGSAGALDELDARISTAIDTVRRISSELRPGVLDRLGLVAGLEWLLRDFEKTSGIVTDLVASSIEEPDPAVATALFRITQETLTNAARHASASLIEVRLREDGDNLELTLRDDGRGFDPAAIRAAPSLGLLGIEERARRLGGTFEIHSAQDQGTTTRIVVPRRTA